MNYWSGKGYYKPVQLVFQSCKQYKINYQHSGEPQMRLSPLFRSQPCFYQLLVVFLFKADGCRRLLCTTTEKDKLLPLLFVCSDPKQLHQTHGFMVRRGLHHDNRLLSSFIESCSVLGLWDYAYSAFTHTTTTNHQTTDILYRQA